MLHRDRFYEPCYRFLIPAGIVIFLSQTGEIFLENAIHALGSVASRYQDALKNTTLILAVTLAVSVLINHRLLLKMFFARRESKWIWYTLVNWVASGALLLSLTHLASFGGLQPLAELLSNANSELKWALAVAVGSFTYLIGFFSVALAFVDVTSKAKSGAGMQQRGGGLTAFVPPVYYFSVVVIAWRVHSSLRYRLFLVLISMTFLGAVNIAWKYRTNLDARSLANKNTGTRVHDDIKSSIPSSTLGNAVAKHSNAATTCNFEVPEQSASKNWYRQLAYDLAVYITPCSILALLLPPVRAIVCVLSLFVGLFPAIYNAIVAYVFLRPTPKENPEVTAFRLKSYPNAGTHLDGWFRMADSDEITKGQVKYLMTFNRHFAVFRGYDGFVRCLDAHCIHLGANMAVGGRVVDNCLECPFHSWQYDGAGQCTHIPYTDKIPDATATRAYYVCEYYGMILIWIHANDLPPSYYPPNIPKIDDGEFVYRGFRNTEVNMNIVEFCENSTDFAHFQPLHGRMAFPFTVTEIPGITVNHSAGWKQGEGDQQHIAWFLDDADLSILGKQYPQTAASAVITFVGPAGVVFFSFETPIGSIVLFQTHTPIEEMRLRVSFQWYATSTMPRPLVWYIVGNWIGQWQNDISVWENKIFARAPILVKGDGPMQKQRRWLKQFYGASSNPVSNGVKEVKVENNTNTEISKQTTVTLSGNESGNNNIAGPLETIKDEESNSNNVVANSANPKVLNTRKRVAKKNMASTDF